MGYAVQHRSLEVKLHHYPDSLRQAGFMSMGKFNAQTLAVSMSQENEGRVRRQLAVAENPAHVRCVIAVTVERESSPRFVRKLTWPFPFCV
jgi:hypothetical protein